jgi:cell wall-associated NlpC family hydrolase
MARFRLNLVEIIRKYIGIPYKLGGKDFSGMDCLALVNSVGRELGVNIPDEFEGICEEDATKLWTDSPDVAKRTLVSYILSLGKKIDISSLFPSDLVLFRDSENDLGVGIYIGNSLILASFIGDKIELVRRENFPIEAVIRWVVGKT